MYAIVKCRRVPKKSGLIFLLPIFYIIAPFLFHLLLRRHFAQIFSPTNNKAIMAIEKLFRFSDMGRKYTTFLHPYVQR